MPGVTLDAGGLIALDRNDRRVIVLSARAAQTNGTVIPAPVSTQAIQSFDVARPDRLAGQGDIVDTAYVRSC